MSVVIQLVGEASGALFPEPLYVQEYRPELIRYWREGKVSEEEAQRYLVATADLAQAKRWPDQAAAWEAWKTEIGTRVHDGKPDRPLTAYTVQIFDPERGDPFALERPGTEGPGARATADDR